MMLCEIFGRWIMLHVSLDKFGTTRNFITQDGLWVVAAGIVTKQIKTNLKQGLEFAHCS